MILDAGSPVIIMSIRHERVLQCINIQIVKSNTREHNVELLHDIYRLICIRVVLRYETLHLCYYYHGILYEIVFYVERRDGRMVSDGIVAYFGVYVRVAAAVTI